MVEALQNLQVVYAKWQERNPYSDSGKTAAAKQNGCVSNGGDGALLASGRQAWRAKFGSVPGQAPQRRPPKHRARGRRENGFTHTDQSAYIQNVAWFKKQPIVQPAAVRHRPFAGRCCDCMPESRSSLYTDALKSAGVHDILRVETMYSSDWFVKTFYHVSFAMQRQLVHRYPDVSLAVLTSARLRRAIQITVSATDDKGLSGDLKSTGKEIGLSHRLERRAKSLVKRISARISNRLVRFTGWFLHKLFGRLLSSIIVHKGQMQMLQQVCKRELPIIFLPTHRSHLDYILITFILFNYNIRAPHVAAGDNLLIPFFGALMRGLGGFFIRRKLDPVAGQKDHVYRAVLYTYMEELLRNGEFLEFFVEGGRTRSGKPLTPKGGLLSVVVDAVSSGVVEDAYIVPVSISYDRLVDGNFVREQMGEPKVYETFWRAVVAIYRILMGYYGIVRVDFCQPYSLTEYMNVYKFYPNTRRPSPSMSGTSLLIDSELAKPVERMSDISLDTCSTDSRHLVYSLAEHVVYSSAESHTVMSSHLLALLLLTSHRQGATLSALISEFDQLKEEVLSRNHDIGFVGETVDVLLHAHHMLGDDIVKMTPSPDTAALLADDQLYAVKLEPVISLPKVFELSYYANVASTVFAVESVIANALFSMVDAEQWLSHRHGTPITISKSRLTTEAAHLCSILKYEYVFAPPCRTLDYVLDDTIDRMRNSDLLVSLQQLDMNDEDNSAGNTEDRLWAKRFASHLECGFDDSDDDTWNVRDETYVLSCDEQILSKFWFLKRVLAAIIETYYVTACRLTLLQQQDIPETEFVHSLHVLLKERIAENLTTFAESASIDTVRNAVHSFRSAGVVDQYEAAGVMMLSLSAMYGDGTLLDDFIRRLEAYRE